MSTAIRRRYTPAQVDLALTTLIFCGDNAAKAVKALQSHLDVPEQTLRDWRAGKHQGRYAELQQELAPRIAEKVAADSEAIALRLNTIEDKLISQLEDKIHELDADKASAALRNVATSKALQFDKIINPLRGRPSVITEQRDAGELLRSLAQRVGITIDSTAEEDPPPQLTA